MAVGGEGRDGWRGSIWQKAAWFGAVVLLLLPLAAMQFTDEVDWTAGDFVFAGVLLFGSLAIFELAARSTRSTAYRVAAGVAVAAVLLLTWSNAAVGITDSSADFVIFWGVPVVCIIGAVVARARPRGMAFAMFAAALALALIGPAALLAGIVPAYNTALEILGITGFFIALFAGAGLLFLQAARDPGGNHGAD